MSQPVQKTVIFDIIGTCFTLSAPEARLNALGAPPGTLQLWFAQSLRDAMALSLAGGYKPLKEVLSADLPRTLARQGVTAPKDEVSRVIESFAELSPRPGLGEAVRSADRSGAKLIALTNSSEQATRGLLKSAGLLEHFDVLLSVDDVCHIKPHPAAYGLAQQHADGEAWMVAAHAWDILGAAQAGLKTAYVTELEGNYPDAIFPAPDVVSANLTAAVSALLTA